MAELHRFVCCVHTRTYGTHVRVYIRRIEKARVRAISVSVVNCKTATRVVYFRNKFILSITRASSRVVYKGIPYLSDFQIFCISFFFSVCVLMENLNRPLYGCFSNFIYRVRWRWKRF